MTDVVTFTITLPVSSPLSETVKYLRAARDERMRVGQMDIAQALNTVVLLAEGGLELIAAGAAPVLVPVSDR